MITQIIIWALVLALFRNQWRFGKDTTDRDGHENHVPIRKRTSAVHNGDVTMKTKYEIKLPVRLGPEWDFSLWFALLSPLIGIWLGFLGGFLREFAKNSRIFAAFTPGANRAPQFFFARKSGSQNSTGIRCADIPSTKGDPRL